MRIAAIAAAGIVAVGAIGAWYTGGKAEDIMRAKVAEINTKVKASYGLDDADGPTLELMQYERGFFSSQAKYRLNLAAVAANLSSVELAPEQSSLEFSDQLEHGPFPWSRLKRLQLLPVMAFSQSTLLPTPLSQPWFDLTQGKSPMQTETSLGYSGQMDGQLTLQAFENTEDGAQVKFSGLTSQFTANESGKNFAFDGKSDSLSIAIKNNNVQMQGLSFKAQSNEGKFGVGLGNAFMQIKNIEVSEGGKSVFAYQDWAVTSVATEDHENIQAEVRQKIGNIKIGGIDFSNFNFDINVANINGMAIKNIIELSEKQDEDSSSNLDLITEQAFNILAGKPNFEIGSSIKTSNGQGALKFTVNLTKPDLPLAALAANPIQVLEQANLKIDISNSFINDVVDAFILNTSKNRSMDPAAIKAKVMESIEATKAKLIAQNLIKIEGDTISLLINYKDNNINWNGVQIPMNMLPMILMSMTGANQGNFDQSEDDNFDEGEALELEE